MPRDDDHLVGVSKVHVDVELLVGRHRDLHGAQHTPRVLKVETINVKDVMLKHKTLVSHCPYRRADSQYHVGQLVMMMVRGCAGSRSRRGRGWRLSAVIACCCFKRLEDLDPADHERAHSAVRRVAWTLIWCHEPV